MRTTCPTQRSCAASKNASIPLMPQRHSTSVFDTLSCHLIAAILRRHRMWNSSSLRTERRYSTQDSHNRNPALSLVPVVTRAHVSEFYNSHTVRFPYKLYATLTKISTSHLLSRYSYLMKSEAHTTFNISVRAVYRMQAAECPWLQGRYLLSSMNWYFGRWRGIACGLGLGPGV